MNDFYNTLYLLTGVALGIMLALSAPAFSELLVEWLDGIAKGFEERFGGGRG